MDQYLIKLPLILDSGTSGYTRKGKQLVCSCELLLNNIIINNHIEIIEKEEKTIINIYNEKNDLELNMR